jgi:hypothetical protein
MYSTIPERVTLPENRTEPATPGQLMVTTRLGPDSEPLTEHTFATTLDSFDDRTAESNVPDSLESTSVH